MMATVLPLTPCSLRCSCSPELAQAVAAVAAEAASALLSKAAVAAYTYQVQAHACCALLLARATVYLSLTTVERWPPLQMTDSRNWYVFLWLPIANDRPRQSAWLTFARAERLPLMLSGRTLWRLLPIP